MITCAYIEQSLVGHVPEQRDEHHVQRGTHAAVALIVRETPSGLQVLFIERAANENDPWSGNISFPGGKVENGDGDPRTTAERETWEEVGIDLGKARYPWAPFRYCQHPHPGPRFLLYLPTGRGRSFPPDERGSSGGILGASFGSNRPFAHGEKSVRFDGQTMMSPGITLPHPGEPALWGLTYLLVKDFVAMLKL